MTHPGPIFVVTGAAGGLGTAVVARLLAGGARVVGVDRHEARAPHLEQAFPPGRHLHIAADITRAESLSSLFDRVEAELGPVDGVAHLVGGFTAGASIDALPDQVWDQMMTLNLHSSFLVLREALRRLRPRRQGSVVLVSSAAAMPGGGGAFPGAAAYLASKAGLLALTEAAAVENKSLGIRVNAVLPTIIRTRANMAAMPDASHDQWVTPEEIAEVIQFLLSPAASGVTGALLKVPGRV